MLLVRDISYNKPNAALQRPGLQVPNGLAQWAHKFSKSSGAGLLLSAQKCTQEARQVGNDNNNKSTDNNSRVNRCTVRDVKDPGCESKRHTHLNFPLSPSGDQRPFLANEKRPAPSRIYPDDSHQEIEH